MHRKKQPVAMLETSLSRLFTRTTNLKNSPAVTSLNSSKKKGKGAGHADTTQHPLTHGTLRFRTHRATQQKPTSQKTDKIELARSWSYLLQKPLAVKHFLRTRQNANPLIELNSFFLSPTRPKSRHKPITLCFSLNFPLITHIPQQN
jgi:hypothetical protein